MIDGYEVLPSGIIKQLKIFNQLMVYNEEYIHTYEKYGEMSINLSYLRLGNIVGTIGFKPSNILDVGYGSGDFLKTIFMSNILPFGSDISGYTVPEGSKFIEWSDVFNQRFEVITFFDSLEHFEDISFVSKLKCNYVVVSLPECHADMKGEEWFKDWKHRKPDEHLWHFNRYSLQNFMEKNGFKCVGYNNVEDLIRKPVDSLPNIITGIFKNEK